MIKRQIHLNLATNLYKNGTTSSVMFGVWKKSFRKENLEQNERGKS